MPVFFFVFCFSRLLCFANEASNQIHPFQTVGVLLCLCVHACVRECGLSLIELVVVSAVTSRSELGSYVEARPSVWRNPRSISASPRLPKPYLSS